MNDRSETPNRGRHVLVPPEGAAGGSEDETDAILAAPETLHDVIEGQADDAVGRTYPEGVRAMLPGRARGELQDATELQAGDPTVDLTPEERRKRLDQILGEVDEKWRDVLDRLGREDGPTGS